MSARESLSEEMIIKLVTEEGVGDGSGKDVDKNMAGMVKMMGKSDEAEEGITFQAVKGL